MMKSFLHSKKGVALIAVLWAVAVMGVITMLLSRQSNLSLKINRNVMQSSQAMLLAEAGVYRAIGELVVDAESTTSDSRNESWFDNQSMFMDIQLGDGVFRLVHPNLETVNSSHYGIMDECSKININVAAKAQLMQLEMMTEEIADAVLDWRDDDSQPQPMGAENQYYNGLTEPYNAKNGLFDSVEELLLVKGVTIDLLYGEDINQNGALDAPENDGADHYPNDNSDGTLRRGWYPYLTIYSYEKNVDGSGAGRLNLNDANKEAMQEKFNGILEENEIDSIIAAREQNNFQSVGDLLDVQLTTQTSGGENNNGRGRNNGGENRGNNRNNNRGGNNNRNQNQGKLSPDKVKQIIDKVTISGESNLTGRINLNTAPESVIKTLLTENPDVVTNIIQERTNKGAFDSIGDLLDVNGVTEDIFKRIANNVCVKSSVFSVRSIGYMPKTSAYKEVMALIDRGVDPPQIRYWKVLR